MKGYVNKSKETKKNKKKLIKIIGVISVFIIGISIIFKIFIKNPAKNFKIGNNTSSQEIVDYILNISSYEAIIEVNVKSNKNENRYIIKQSYKGTGDNTQEVLEPSNIAGIKIIKDEKNLKLENSKLNLTSMFENYQYISDNSLDLNSFLEDYKKDERVKLEEKESNIIMQTSSEKQPNQHKTLYINKETGMPERMEIRDTNKNIAVYILYKEVSVNS